MEVIGEAQNIKEAVPLLHEVTPQLVFLDVEMPFGNAFDVLEACKDLQFETIFVTAFSEYSLKALNQSAAYYLLKPISIEELIVAVNKVQQHILNNELFNRNRIIVENFRQPDAPLVGMFTRGQFFSFFLIAIGLAFIIVGKIRDQHAAPKPEVRFPA